MRGVAERIAADLEAPPEWRELRKLGVARPAAETGLTGVARKRLGLLRREHRDSGYQQNQGNAQQTRWTEAARM
jgi:hypothetical protein